MPTRMRNRIAWILAGLAAVAALAFGGVPLRMLATPVLIVFLVHVCSLVHGRTRNRIPGWAIEAAGPVVLGIAAVVLYGRLLLGDVPVNHDHPVMLVRAWITGTQIIPRGSLTGFSLAMFAGYPANSLYSMGTDLLICTVKALGLGLPSWETAYCWALFLFVLSYPLALYALGRRCAGPLAGLVAGVLGLLDRGLWFQSGWDFNLNWGVWSMGLSFSMCLFAMLALDRLLTGPSLLALAATAFSTGFAILCHPMALAILGVSLPLLVLVKALTERLGAPGIWLPRTVAAVVLAGCLASFWLLPFVARQAWFEPLADPWHSFDEVLRGLTDGNLFFQLCPAFLYAGLLGLLVGTRHRKSFPTFLLVASALLLFFSSNTFLTSFDVLKKFPSLANLQPQRFAYFVRTALLLGCGLLVHYVVKSTLPDSTRVRLQESPARRVGRRLLLGAAAAPFLLFLAHMGPSPYLAPSRPLTWSSGSDLYRDLRAAAAFLNQQDPGALDRIAVVAPSNQHLLMSLPVYTGLDIFKVGFTPENNYRFKFESRHADVWRAVNVSHVLSLGRLHRDDLEEMGHFGKLFLYRFERYDPARLSLEGPGRAALERNEPEAMDIRLADTGPSRLVVHRARYALWEAWLNGRPVPIEGATIGDSPPVFMSLPAEDGLLRLRYRSGAPEWLGCVLSWIGLLVLGLVLAAGLSRRVGRRLAGWLRPLAGPVRDGTTLLSLGVLLLGVGALVFRLVLPATPSFPGKEVVSDLMARLPRARAEVIRPGSSRSCQAYDGDKIKCPGPAWNYAGEVLVTADHLLRHCIWLHPIQGAKFTLHFDEVPLGDHIQGHCAIADLAAEPPSSHHVHLTVLLDGVELGRFTCPSRRGWHPWHVDTPGRRGTTGRVTFQSDAPYTGRRHFCFTAYTTVDRKE